MVGMARRRTTKNRGVRLSYELRGRLRRRRRPWLVLVQGLGFDHNGWGPGVRGLGRRFRLVLLDNRGSGRSDVPPPPYSVEEMADDVVAVLDAARIKRAHVLGASLGGMIAQELAINHPDRVDRLVLVCTTPGWGAGYPFPPSNTQLLWETAQMPTEAGIRRRIEHALAPSTVGSRPGLVDRLVAHQLAHPQDPLGRWAQASAGVGYSNRFRDTSIRARTLVLHGTSDGVVDPGNARVLAARIPEAHLELIPDAGHLLFWEQPQRFVELVTHFLEEGEQSRTRWRLVHRDRAAA
jgi:3-oxoadipate enol-lactonase